MPATPEVEGISIVCVGSFNPAIFQPRWLAAHDLLRPEEATAAEAMRDEGDLLVSSAVTSFRAEWLVLQVTPEKCVAATDDPSRYRALRDLVVGMFGILLHTPVVATGTHLNAHFRSASVEEWHSIGHRLAPKEMWRELVQDPGLETLVVSGTRQPGVKTRVKVEPSRKVTPGVFVQVHDERRARPGEHDVAPFMDHLRTSFDEFLEYAQTAAARVVREANPA